MPTAIVDFSEKCKNCLMSSKQLYLVLYICLTNHSQGIRVIYTHENEFFYVHTLLEKKVQWGSI